MERKDFIYFSLESILQVLKKYDLELKIAEKENDTEKTKLLKEEIIPKYDRLYFGFKHTDFKEKTNEEVQSIEKTINDILEKNNISKTYIKKCIEKREALKENSGAEVTKNLFLYTIKELEKKKGILHDKLKPLLEKEKQLEADLKECIQYDEEMRMMDTPFVLKKLGLEESEFNKIMNENPKSFLDYPNNYKIIVRIKKFTNVLRLKGLYSK